MASKFKKGCKVAPKSTKDIEQEAKELRFRLNMDNVDYADMVQVYELLMQIQGSSFQYEVCDDNELSKDILAQFDLITQTIFIKNWVYEKTAKGDGLGRFTLAHELYHALCHQYQPLPLKSTCSDNHKDYEDSEWQANAFAAAFLAPRERITDDMTTEQIASTFGLSKEAAACRRKNTRPQKTRLVQQELPLCFPEYKKLPA